MRLAEAGEMPLDEWTASFEPRRVDTDELIPAEQRPARIAFDLRKRPDVKAMAKLAEKWRPWRGVAAHLLWAYYHVVKRREGAPVQATWPAVTKKQKANGVANGR